MGEVVRGETAPVASAYRTTRLRRPPPAGPRHSAEPPPAKITDAYSNSVTYNLLVQGVGERH
ncbi:hypothetical protein, partial [Streptomyces eurythermus]